MSKRQAIVEPTAGCPTIYPKIPHSRPTGSRATLDPIVGLHHGLHLLGGGVWVSVPWGPCVRGGSSTTVLRRDTTTGQRGHLSRSIEGVARWGRDAAGLLSCVCRRAVPD